MIDVLVVGAGPTGLTTAAEAVRHGLSVRIIDISKARSEHSKALVLHSRSLEIFTDMGFIGPVLETGREFRALNVYADDAALSRIDFRAIDWQDALYPFWLSIPQSETERHIEEHLALLGVEVERRTQLVELVQFPDRVVATVELLDEEGEPAGQELIEAKWIVGCDGARSTTRKLSNIPFEGTADNELFILGDVFLDWDEPEDEGYNFMSSDGILLVVPLPNPKQFRIIAHMPALSQGDKPTITLELFQQLMDQRSGKSSHVLELGWHSSFGVKHLVAAQHRHGRVFLAGDAAHIHSPVGGQGLNTGIQDAYNLMWKLALRQQGWGTKKLLDSYEVERHAIAEKTIKRVSFATNVVTLTNPISRTLRNQLASILINTDAVHNRMGRDVGMLDIAYRNSNVVGEDAPRTKLMERLLNSFRDKSIGFDKGPQSGERMPNIIFNDQDGDTHSFVNYMYGTEHTLLLFMGIADQKPSHRLYGIKAAVEQQFGEVVRTLLVTTAAARPVDWAGPVVANPDQSLHQRYGATVETLYLIRPDNHIGYRSQPANLSLLQDYLMQILIPSEAYADDDVIAPHYSGVT